ncbi:hypothetical protein IEQ34_011297 [Dendrobium chrysotoxum]|uniref:Uncharacterized protein n=1 Tax=Dendrobium chrysotoxum TaxID=161865 RepID=A0AAV7GFT8_DENCH|nr:hypothetical protein IEQ34_011297 [Dendrobium chrysotoxum]
MVTKVAGDRAQEFREVELYGEHGEAGSEEEIAKNADFLSNGERGEAEVVNDEGGEGAGGLEVEKDVVEERAGASNRGGDGGHSTGVRWEIVD